MQATTYLRNRIAVLEKANSEAPGWGAAVGARLEEIGELKSELRRLETAPPRHPEPAPLADELAAALAKIVNNWDNLHPKDRAQARVALARYRSERSKP